MEIKLTAFETSIKNFLDDLAQSDELFAKTYQKPNKSIAECCKYIYQQVEKNRKGGARCVGCEDEEIYGLAIHYYDEDDIEVSGPTAKVEDVKHVPEPKDTAKTAKPKKSKKAEVVVDDDIPSGLVIPLFN